MQILSPPFQLTPVGKPICSVQHLQACHAEKRRRTEKAFVLREELAQFGQIPAVLLHDRLDELRNRGTGSVTSCGFEGRDRSVTSHARLVEHPGSTDALWAGE
jgi:hypothetical protein